MKKLFQFSAFIAMFFVLLVPQISYGQGADLYDYEGGMVVLNINQPVTVGIPDYVCYTKTFQLTTKEGNNLGKVTVTIEVSQKENYYMIELVTWGSEGLTGNGGLGNRMGIMPYSDDWNLRKDTQAIYANGMGFQAALKDLEAKFNGTNGKISITGTGEPTKGNAVITIKKR